LPISGEITLLATGPLTNVAMALSLDERFGAKLKDCIIMGGNTSGKLPCIVVNRFSLEALNLLCRYEINQHDFGLAVCEAQM